MTAVIAATSATVRIGAKMLLDDVSLAGPRDLNATLRPIVFIIATVF